MEITLTQIFDEQFKEVKFNSKLAKELYHYQIKFLNLNQEHMEFFGGNLLGVQIVRFKDSDLLRLYDEVFDVDYYYLEQQLRKVTTINHEYKVSGDVLNLTLMYVIHKFLTSPLIGDRERERAVYDTALIFFYRCIAALLSAYFRYPADPKIAQAAYAKLSQKYLIKRLGSWHKVMDYRAKDLIAKNGLHYKKLVSFNDDLDIVYIINDAQGRIRDLVKNYYAEFKTVHTDGENIAVTSSVFLDAEGEEVVKDKINTTENSLVYIRSLMRDKHSFVKDELVQLINKINTNTSFRMMKSVLFWLSDNYESEKYHKDIDSFIEKLVIHSFYLLKTETNLVNMRDYPHILTSLKNMYLSTRSTDQDLMEIRALGEKLVLASQPDKMSKNLVISTRTSIILYIAFRTIIGVGGR